MSAHGVLIRPATRLDEAAVLELIRGLDPGDYLLAAWPRWVGRPGAVTLIAEVGHSPAAIIGCIYGEPTVADDAWMQGARVDRRFQRLSIGSELMRAVQRELCQRGAHAVFGTISAFNEASLAMVDRLSWQAVARISRRRARGGARERAGAVVKTPAGDAGRVSALLGGGAAFGSRREQSYFRRRYFTMSPAHLARMGELGAVRVLPDEGAVAILDREAPESVDSLWVTALAGEQAGLRWLLDRLSAEAAGEGRNLLIDAPETPEIEAMLDERGFDPVDRDARFVVVRKLLGASEEHPREGSRRLP